MDVPVESKREIDPRLESIVNRMFQRCLEDGQYKQALGLALETRRMDIFERSILESVSHVVLLLHVTVLSPENMLNQKNTRNYC